MNSMKNGAEGVVFIHGFGGAGALWARQTAAFLRWGHASAVDLPGHGTMPWAGEGLDQMAEGILHKGFKGPRAVVASSFGGLVALVLWQKAPQLCSSLTFVGSLPRFTACDGYPAGLTDERIRKLALQLQGDVPVVLEMFFRSLFTRQERESASYHDVRSLRGSIPVPSRQALLDFLDILRTADLRALLASVDVPVQFILGDGDYICPLEVAGALSMLSPGARIDLMKGCGHFPFLSRPDEFNMLVRDFIV